MIHRLAAAAAAVLALAIPAASLAQTALPANEAAALTRGAGVPFAGDPHGDVTIVEFFDYNCPFCKRLQPELAALLHADPKVRILYKDWPIFGDVSHYAAEAGLAARFQGKYLQAHDALMGSRSRLASRDQVRHVLASAGVDLARLDRDLKVHAGAIHAELTRNDHEAQALGLQGTPGLVIGRILIPGGLGLPQLEGYVARARGVRPATAIPLP